jgi:hypothetical protein
VTTFGTTLGERAATVRARRAFATFCVRDDFPAFLRMPAALFTVFFAARGAMAFADRPVRFTEFLFMAAI